MTRCDELISKNIGILRKYDVNKDGILDVNEAVQINADWNNKLITDQQLADIAEFKMLGCVIPPQSNNNTSILLIGVGVLALIFLLKKR